MLIPRILWIFVREPQNMLCRSSRGAYRGDMRVHPIWHGTRTRRIAIGADPDAKPRLVTLPAAWEDSAAGALAGLAPGDGAVAVAAAADVWAGALEPELKKRALRLLLL